MTGRGAYGSRLGDAMQVERAPAFVVRGLQKTEIAVTEIRSDDPRFAVSGSIPPEDAFLVALQVREYPNQEYWEDGRQAPVRTLAAGCTILYDLKRDPVFYMNNPFHSVNFYFPRAALNAIGDNAEAPRIGELRYEPGVGVDDPVMRPLVMSLLPAFNHPEQASRLFVEHVTLAVGAHVAHAYGGMQVTRRAVRGGLAPWQERRAKEILGGNLDGAVALASLAKECGLSISHFSRAFRQTTGLAPHQWLLQRRVEEAKQILRDRDRALSEVALACGFADQSHFTRVFSRAVGTSPGAWRRRLEE